MPGHLTSSLASSLQESNVLPFPSVCSCCRAIGLVIEGGALAVALQPQNESLFLQLCHDCRAVVCCRVSPRQKSLVTSLVKHRAGICLGIGDGANDVGEGGAMARKCFCSMWDIAQQPHLNLHLLEQHNFICCHHAGAPCFDDAGYTSVWLCRARPLHAEMCRHTMPPLGAAGMIQAAHIGIGISGREGRAAVLASDFHFGQFRFLPRLLLIHGRWAMKRNLEVVMYMFYKNLVSESIDMSTQSCCCHACQVLSGLLLLTVLVYRLTISRIYYMQLYLVSWSGLVSSFGSHYEAWSFPGCVLPAGCSSLPYYSTIFIASYNVMWSSLPIIGLAIFEQVRKHGQKALGCHLLQFQASESSSAGPQTYQHRAESSALWGNSFYPATGHHSSVLPMDD